MGIRIKGASRRYTSEIILERAVGIRDEKYHRPLELIHLQWTPYKKNYHQAKTKGFEDTFITRDQAKGIIIEHRLPGSAEWLKDGLTGAYIATIARTDWNMRILASMYYDKLWTIKESHIEMIVKQAADAIDEENKTIPYTYEEKKRVLSPDGKSHLWVYEKVTKTMYDFHKARREMQFQVQDEAITSAPVNPNFHSMQLQEKEAQIERKRMELEEREALLKQREDAAPKQIAPEQKQIKKTDSETKESLAKSPIGSLRKRAKELGVANTFKMNKETLVSAVYEKLEEEEKAMVPVEETEEIEMVVN